MKLPVTRLSSRARIALSTVVAVVAAGMLATGLAVPASATPALTDYTVKVVNKAGAPLAGVDVYAIQVANGAEVLQDPAWQAVPVTGKAGYYKFSTTQPAGHKAGAAPTNGQLNVGADYTLEFDPTGTPAKSAFAQFLGGATWVDDAKIFQPGGANTSLTASLAGNGVISGHVTGPTGKALSKAAVQAYNFDGTNWFPYSFTYTSSTGAYSLTNIDPGSYRIEVYPAAGNYPPIYSGGAHTFDAASSVYVGLGGTATVNAKFTAGKGSISGTAKIFYDDFGVTVPFSQATPVAIPVTSASGSVPTALDQDKSVYGAASSSKGAWSITGLSAGQYVVQMEPYYVGDPTYFLAAGSPVSTFTQARIFTVGSGKVSAGTTTFDGTAEQGGYFEVSAWAPGTTSTPYTAGVLDYSIANDTVSYDSDEVANKNGSAILGFDPDLNFGEGGGVLQPGKYTLTVTDPAGVFLPITRDIVLQAGENFYSTALTLPSPAPGFSAPATIAETDTVVGTTYTVAATSARSTATASYQWFRDGHTIFGADAASYTSTGADVDHQLSVRVAESEFGLAPQYSTASVAGVVTEGAPASNTGAQPSLSPTGDQYIGTVLSVNPGGWDESGLSYTYTWLSNGTPIDGATGRTYTLTAADVTAGATITAQVVASRPGYAASAPVDATASAKGKLRDAPVATTKPTITYKISGSKETATVKTGKWSVSGVTVSYSWTAPGGTPVSGATTTFTKGATAAEPRLATVTASRAGYVSGTTSVVSVKGTSAVVQDPSGPEQVVDATSHEPIDDPAADVAVGHKLAISEPGTWNGGGLPTPVTVKYQWLRTVGSKTTVVSTTSSYTVTSKDLGASFSVVESATSSKYASGVSEPVFAGLAVQNSALAETPATVKLPASAAPGQSIKATVGAWPTTGVAVKYEWFGKADPTDPTDPITGEVSDDGFVQIAKATASSLKIPSGYSWIVAVVSGTKAGYEEGHAVSTALAVNAAKVTHAPTIVKSSDDLQVTAGTATPAGGTWTYQWYSGGEPDGESSATPTEHVFATTGQALYLEATYTAGTSTATVRIVAQKGTATVSTDKAVVGSHYGETLKLDATTPIAMPGRVAPTIKYQWYVAGKAISGATKSTYAVSSSYIGKSVDVRVSASSGLYNSVTWTSSAVKIASGSFAGVGEPTVTYTGTAKPGTVLTALHGSGYPSSTTVSYSWRRSVGGGAFATISGATRSTYTLQAADALATVDVVVKSSKTHYTTASVPGEPISVSAPDEIAPIVAPTLTGLTAAGDAKVGVKLTVNPGTWNTASLTYTYAWYRNDVLIPGATGTTYTPVATSYGDLIQARVSVARAGYGTASVETQAVTVDLGAAPVPTTTPKIVKSGSTYVVSQPGWSVDGLTFSFQWKVGGVDGTGVGATTDTYTPAAGESGQLTLEITAVRAGYVSTTLPVTGPVLVGAP